MPMKRWWRLGVVLFCLNNFSSLYAFGQDSTKCYLDYIKIIYNSGDGKSQEVSDAVQVNIDNLNNLKFSIIQHSTLDEYIKGKLRIEVILARGTERVGVVNFSGGIDSFNKPNAFSELISLVQAGDRLVLDIKGEKQCSEVIVLSGLKPMDPNSYKTMKLSDIILQATSSDGDSILFFSGLNIVPGTISPRSLNRQPDKDGMVMLKKRIYLENCNFLFRADISFKSISFLSLVISHTTNANLRFENGEFRKNFYLEDCEGYNLEFKNTSFSGYCEVVKSNFEKLQIANSKFANSDSVSETVGLEPYYQVLISGKYKEILLDSNRMEYASNVKSISIGGETEILRMEGNHLDAHLNLQTLKVVSQLSVFNNHFSKNVFLNGIQIPEKGTEFYWNQLSGDKLGLINPVVIKRDGYNESIERFYFGSEEQDLKQEIQFKRLLKTYQQLSDIYKTNGDQESANGCYSEMKDVEGRRLAYLYKTQGGFQKYFRWKLNRLMKFYTDHGTDPAKAIVISIWVVICFGIFYFFFPSDWDTTSKSKLIQNFKDFIQKNEKGYVIPFFVLLGGFSVSLLNAVTLSLNSFVTLGFGNIPTHGLARYVTILEGFIGWFLLSIFTVALINQVLS